MGLEDLRRNLNNKKSNGVLPQNQPKQSVGSAVVGAFKDVMGWTQNQVVQHTGKRSVSGETPEWVRFDENGNLLSVFSGATYGTWFLGDYHGPWLEGVLRYLVNRDCSVESLADAFSISYRDSQELMNWLIRVGWLKQQFGNRWRLSLNESDVEFLIKKATYFNALSSYVDVVENVWPLDAYSVIDKLFDLRSIAFVDEAVLRQLFCVGYRRAAWLYKELQMLGIISAGGRVVFDFDGMSVFLDINMRNHAVELPYNHWGGSWHKLFYSYRHNPVVDNSFGSDLPKRKDLLFAYFSSVGIDDAYEFIRIFAHCIAEDDEYFDGLQRKIYTGELHPFKTMSDLINLLKKFGWLASIDARGHVHAALSYDDADLLVDNYIALAKSEAFETTLKSSSLPVQTSIDDMSGIEFEQYCKTLLIKNGFTNVQETSTSGDRGIDLIAEKDDIKYAVQCKCYSGNVGNKAVQEAYSGKGIYDADVAVVMTNSHFTAQAIEDAKRLRVKLWDGDYITSLARSEKEK